MLLRALFIWCGLLTVAFVNGIVRAVWLAPAFGDSVAHVISAVMISIVVAAVTWEAIGWLHPHSANEALLIGDEWVLLTIGFEVLAGYVLLGTSWHRLLMEFNVTQGEQWELVLVTMLVAPAVAAIRQHVIAPGRPISSVRKAFFGR